MKYYWKLLKAIYSTNQELYVSLAFLIVSIPVSTYITHLMELDGRNWLLRYFVGSLVFATGCLLVVLAICITLVIKLQIKISIKKAIIEIGPPPPKVIKVKPIKVKKIRKQKINFRQWS